MPVLCRTGAQRLLLRKPVSRRGRAFARCGLYRRRLRPMAPTKGVLYASAARSGATLRRIPEAGPTASGCRPSSSMRFRTSLRSGVLAHGFARVRRVRVRAARAVQRKGRGFCPSCSGRRTAERAAHRVEHVLPPDVPVRRSSRTPSPALPTGLRSSPLPDGARRLRPGLRSADRRQAKRAGLAGGETGMVTSVQRFGGAGRQLPLRRPRAC